MSLTDLEIKNYLNIRNWKVDPQEFLMDVLNTSHQIISENYDSRTKMMTVVTPDNTFVFKWNLLTSNKRR